MKYNAVMRRHIDKLPDTLYCRHSIADPRLVPRAMV